MEGDVPGFTSEQAQTLVDRHNYFRAQERARGMVKLVNTRHMICMCVCVYVYDVCDMCVCVYVCVYVCMWCMVM